MLFSWLKAKHFDLAAKSLKVSARCFGINRDGLVELILQNPSDGSGRFSNTLLTNTGQCFYIAFFQAFSSSSTSFIFRFISSPVFIYGNILIPYRVCIRVNRKLLISETGALLYFANPLCQYPRMFVHSFCFFITSFTNIPVSITASNLL